MTNTGPECFDANQQRIRIAIHEQLADPQHVAARFAFFPKLVSRAAEKHSFSGALGLGEGLRIHEAEHQHLAGALVLDDGRHQPAAFLKVDLHALPPENTEPENKNPAGACCASGPKSALFSESLCTPQQARRMAMVMVRRSCMCAIHCEV